MEFKEVAYLKLIAQSEQMVLLIRKIILHEHSSLIDGSFWVCCNIALHSLQKLQNNFNSSITC